MQITIAQQKLHITREPNTGRNTFVQWLKLIFLFSISSAHLMMHLINFPFSKLKRTLSVVSRATSTCTIIYKVHNWQHMHYRNCQLIRIFELCQIRGVVFDFRANFSHSITVFSVRFLFFRTNCTVVGRGGFPLSKILKYYETRMVFSIAFSLSRNRGKHILSAIHGHSLHIGH